MPQYRRRRYTVLSAVKNFALTFIISLLVFSLLAYFIVGYALNNLVGIAGGSDTSETTTVPTPVITDSNGGIIDIDLPDTGTSFNLLLVMTDYEPSFYAYDPAVLETIFGKKDETTHEPAPLPTDLAAPRRVALEPDSDPEDGDSIYGDNGDPMIPGGFYQSTYQSVTTQAMVLMRFDRERSQVTFSAFPIDAVTVMDGRYIAVGDIYAKYGKNILCDAIHSLTGCLVDGYAIVHPDGLKALVDTLGGIYFNVPCEMDFGDVIIKSGNQMLDGSKAVRVLGYGLYVEAGQSREKTAVDFAGAVMSNITQITNYPNAAAVYRSLAEYVETDYTEEMFLENRDFIFKYAQLPHDTRDPVMRTMQVGEKRVSVLDSQATLLRFSDYRRILTDDSEKQ